MSIHTMFLTLFETGDVTVTLWICADGERVLHIESHGQWDDAHIDYSHISGSAFDGLVEALTERENWLHAYGDDAAFYNMQQNEADGSCTFYFVDRFEPDTHELMLTAEQQSELLAFITQQDTDAKIRGLLLGNLPETVLLMNFSEDGPLNKAAKTWLETCFKASKQMVKGGASAEEATALIVTMMKLSRSL